MWCLQEGPNFGSSPQPAISGRKPFMRNIFLVYMPPNNAAAMQHYRETIQNRVAQERIARYLTRDERDRLHRVIGDRSVAVWGSRDGERNRQKFDKMEEGDDLLIVEGDRIKFLGKIAMKTIKPELSRELWRGGGGDTQAGWDLIYFIANPLPLDIPFDRFCRLLGYRSGYQLRGFTTVGPQILADFYSRYDDLYSILTRIQAGLPVLERPAIEGELVAVAPEELDQVLTSDLVSDHVRMQWTLAKLGRKAGAKVWIPVSDQAKLKKVYAFNEFESEFAAGLDLPRSSVENIDVVWKEDFRIDAAFEVENSTAIYSGLLRFADLTTLAPNTTYPMFIVAPAERRTRVRDQLMRPTFRRLELSDRVKFLPYETVDDIQKFFASASGGVTVEMMWAKAETMAT